jgi:hypothetical protein
MSNQGVEAPHLTELRARLVVEAKETIFNGFPKRLKDFQAKITQHPLFQNGGIKAARRNAHALEDSSPKSPTRKDQVRLFFKFMSLIFMCCFQRYYYASLFEIPKRLDSIR